MVPGELTDPGTEYGIGTGRELSRLADRLAAGLARRERALWALVCLALLADVGSTGAGLQLGHAEGTPVVAGVLADAGVVGFLAVKGGVVAAAVATRLALPRFRVAIPVGLALPWLAAAGINAALLLGVI